MESISLSVVHPADAAVGFIGLSTSAAPVCTAASAVAAAAVVSSTATSLTAEKCGFLAFCGT